MQNYKFRGKRIDNGEWVYGSLREENKHYYILTDEYSVLISQPNMPALGCGVEDGGWQKNGYTAAEYGWNDCIERYAEMLPTWYEVIPETVGQFTGLTDRFGFDIYEGDLLQVWRSVGENGKLRGKYIYPLPVEYCTDWTSFVVVDKPNKNQYIINQQFGAYEIIGNIHEVTP